MSLWSKLLGKQGQRDLRKGVQRLARHELQTMLPFPIPLTGGRAEFDMQDLADLIVIANSVVNKQMGLSILESWLSNAGVRNK